MIEAKLIGLEKIIRITNPQLYKKASVRAMNHTATHIRKFWISLIKQRFAVKSSYLRERVFEIRRASRNKPTAIVAVKEKKSFSLFHAYPTRQTAAGVQTEIRKGKKVLIPHGFIVAGKGAYIRQKQGGRLVPRLPIRFLRGAGVGLLVRNQELQERLEKEAVEYGKKELEREIKYYLQKGV